MLLEHREMIRRTVIARGVPAREVNDTVAACLLAAWEAIREQRFRVYKRADPAKALERWLCGIAWRLATHKRDRAHHRREVLLRNPWAHAHAVPVLDPDGQIAARAELLRTLRALPPERSALLIAVAAGMTTAELAARLSVTQRHAVPDRPGSQGVEGEDRRRRGRWWRVMAARVVVRGARRKVPQGKPLNKDRVFHRVFRQETNAAVLFWLERLKLPPRDRWDVLQDVFCSAHRSFHTYDPMRGWPERWLNKIAVHVASHYLACARHRREFLRAEMPLTMLDPAQALPEQIEAEQDRRLGSVNVLCGETCAGKTNLLEGLALLSAAVSGSIERGLHHRRLRSYSTHACALRSVPRGPIKLEAASDRVRYRVKLDENDLTYLAEVVEVDGAPVLAREQTRGWVMLAGRRVVLEAMHDEGLAVLLGTAASRGVGPGFVRVLEEFRSVNPIDVSKVSARGRAQREMPLYELSNFVPSWRGRRTA